MKYVNVEFSNGFTITVMCEDGGVFEKATSKPFIIKRNDLSRMAALEVVQAAPDGYYIDEYGVNQGKGVTIDGITWAPVNCGYKPATDESRGYPYGKMYQWGRKYGQGYGEPYYNASDPYSDETTPRLQPCWSGENEDSDKDTFYYGISEPYNWITSEESFWNAGTEESPQKNEMYDPCPEGWRVPTEAELLALFRGNHSELTTHDGIYGVWASGSVEYNDNLEERVFIPAAGGRFADNRVHNSGACGRGDSWSYWSSAQRNGYGVNVGEWGKNELGTTYKAFGHSVRCCRTDSVPSVPTDPSEPTDPSNPVSVTSVSLSKTSLSLSVGQSETIHATVLPENATDKTVTWSSSSPETVSVDNGRITALKEGAATISAKAGDKTATCSVTVKPTQTDPIVLSATSINADCLDGATVSVQVEAKGHWTAKETGGSMLSLSMENGEPGTSNLTITINGDNSTNSERVANLEFKCDGVSKNLTVNQLPAFQFDSLEQIVPSSGGTYRFSFKYADNNGTRKIYFSGDDGFNKLRNETVYDNSIPAPAALRAAAENAPAMYSFNTSLEYKPNYSSESRSGRFRLYFEENEQRLYSEWINVTQLPDEITADEADGIQTVLKSHSKGSGVPVVILGDGFTKSDILGGAFAQAAEKACEYFFSAEPYASLQEFFDVWSVTSVSPSRTFNGSGTRFGCRNTSGTTIEGNNDLAFHYACKVVPPEKQKDMTIIVVMNTNIYAGTCVSTYFIKQNEITLAHSTAYVPMTNRNGLTFEDVLHHEACGHGMGKLADEYSGSTSITSNAKEQLSSFHKAGGYVNVDVESDVSESLWAQFAEDPRFSYENIGAYEGAYTYRYGVYRPTEDSIMNKNVGVFNAPSRAQIYRRVMSIAYDWNWTFDYESFVNFDAPFRERYYSSSTMMAPDLGIVNTFIPLAPPVLIEVDESMYSTEY